MWFNQAKCDIYIGTAAGTELLKEIGNAQKSIKIVSPQISLKLVHELVLLHHKGVRISMVTSESLSSQKDKQLHAVKPLILQYKDIDEKAANHRRKWKKVRLYLRWGNVFLLAIISLATYLTNNWLYLYLVALVLIPFFISIFLGRKIKNKKVYSYSYSKLFPLKVFIQPDLNRSNNTFIHSKIYIIDGSTAYLGSFNFTEQGTEYNNESRIRVADVEAVKKIEEAFDEIFNRADLAFFDIEQWGKYLYPEPIN